MPGRSRRCLRRFHTQVRRVSARRRTPARSWRTAPATPRWPRTRQRWRATLPPRSSATASTPRACRSSASRQCLASVLRVALLLLAAQSTPAACDAQLRAEAAPRHARRWGAPAASTGSHGAASRPPPVLRGRPFRGLPARRSTHTKDLMAAERTCTEGGKAALCVTAKGFEGAADGRVTLIGDVKRVSDKEVEADGLRALYKAKHPNAYRPHVVRSHLGGAAAHRPGPIGAGSPRSPAALRLQSEQPRRIHSATRPGPQ